MNFWLAFLGLHDTHATFCPKEEIRNKCESLLPGNDLIKGHVYISLVQQNYCEIHAQGGFFRIRTDKQNYLLPLTQENGVNQLQLNVNSFYNNRQEQYYSKCNFVPQLAWALSMLLYKYLNYLEIVGS